MLSLKTLPGLRNLVGISDTPTSASKPKASKLDRHEVSKQSPTVIKQIPYTAHIDERTIKTVNGGYLRTWRVEGVPSLTLDESELNAISTAYHQQLQGIPHEGIALYTHFIRKRISLPDGEEFIPGSFADGLNQNYREHIKEKGLYANELYLSILYTPQQIGSKNNGKNIGKKNPSATGAQLDKEALKHLDQVATTIAEGLSRYHGLTALKVYKMGKHYFSKQLEFLHYLISGYDIRFPVTSSNLQTAMLTSRLLFRHEVGEIHAPASTVHIAALGIKSYPDETFPGQLSALYGLPFEFVLTQSFALLGQTASRNLLTLVSDRLEQTEDAAVSQQVAITGGGEGTALDDLTSGRISMGEHHLVFLVRGKSIEEVNRHIAKAVQTFSNAAYIAVREDLALAAAYWSQLPGNLSVRPRPSPITSRNAAGLMALYGESKGKPDGNHWGKPTTVLRTILGTAYDFSFHVRDVGHTFICAPTGSGKTTAQLFLAAMQEPAKVTQVFFDYGSGSAIYVWAKEGRFFQFQPGEPTGMNPMLMENTRENILFTQKLFKHILTSEGKILPERQEHELNVAINTVFNLSECSLRRPRSLLDFMNRTEPDGLARKLARWVGDGQMAYLFDNQEDTIDFGQVTGFNIKQFIDDDELRTPTMMYLFHRMEELNDGRRLRVDVGEFWKALDDPYFSEWIKSFLNTKRKENAMFVGETGNPLAMLDSSIASTIMQQTPTKIYLSNPNASRDVYMGQLKLSQVEYEWVVNMGPRRMLIMQNDLPSVMVELDLGGKRLWDDLAVLSVTSESAILLEDIRKKVGDDPAKWRPLFNQERRRRSMM